MCQKVSCPHCSKPTWKGCGMHIQRALQDVLIEDRCPNWPKVSNVARAAKQQVNELSGSIRRKTLTLPCSVMFSFRFVVDVSGRIESVQQQTQHTSRYERHGARSRNDGRRYQPAKEVLKKVQQQEFEWETSDQAHSIKARIDLMVGRPVGLLNGRSMNDDARENPQVYIQSRSLPGIREYCFQRGSQSPLSIYFILFLPKQ